MRRHRSRFHDLAAKMSSAGAGAVVSGSGANYELRGRFEQFHSRGGFQLHHRAQCLPRCASHRDPDTNTDADCRSNENPEADTDTKADTDANVLARDDRTVSDRNGTGEQYGSIQRAGNFRSFEYHQKPNISRYHWQRGLERGPHHHGVSREHHVSGEWADYRLNDRMYLFHGHGWRLAAICGGRSQYGSKFVPDATRGGPGNASRTN